VAFFIIESQTPIKNFYLCFKLKAMSNLLKINNVQKLSSNFVRIYFEANFTLTNLRLQYSLDNSDWSNNIQLSSTISPQDVVLPIDNSCYLRINDDNYVPPTPPPVIDDLILINSTDSLLIDSNDSLEV
jgi:hypothetical protein